MSPGRGLPKPMFAGLGHISDSFEQARNEDRPVFDFGEDPVPKFGRLPKAAESLGPRQPWKESTFGVGQLLTERLDYHGVDTVAADCRHGLIVICSSDQRLPLAEDQPLPFSTPKTTRRDRPAEISPFLKTSKTRVPFLKLNGNHATTSASIVVAEELRAVEENTFMRQLIRLEKEGAIEETFDEGPEDDGDPGLLPSDQMMRPDPQGASKAAASSDDTFEHQNRVLSKSSGVDEELNYMTGFNQDAEDPLACSPTFAQAILTSSGRLGNKFQSPLSKRQETKDNEDAKTFAGIISVSDLLQTI